MDWYFLIFPMNADLFFLWLTFWVFANLHHQNSHFKISWNSYKVRPEKKCFQIFFKCSRMNKSLTPLMRVWNWVNPSILIFMNFFLVSGVCQCQSEHKWIPKTSHLSSALPGVRLWRDKGRNSWLNNRHKPSQGSHTSLFETLSVTRAV